MSATTEQMEDIRCRCCWRFLGVGPTGFRIYCDHACAEDYPAAVGEGKEALMEAIYLAHRPTKQALGAVFGVSRQRVEQVLKRRDLTA